MTYPLVRSRVKTLLIAAFALMAFAANSLLCRQALGTHAIDPSTFTGVRLLAGAATLMLLSRVAGTRTENVGGSWKSAAELFLYAAAFSGAYVSLTAGTGALILFGAVQVTMILAGVRSGERPGRAGWSGLALAVTGLCILTFPGVSAPSPPGLVLMALAGASWGRYSLSGRGTADPLGATTGNFMRAVPFAIVLCLLSVPWIHASGEGVFLAVVSGSLASAVGYVAWYAALPGMTATLAATVQLVVPVLAAVAGVLVLSEEVTVRLIVAAGAIIGGVGISIAGRSPKPRFRGRAQS